MRYNKAFALYHQLKTNLDELEANNISYDLFTSNSLAAIKLAKPVLSQHRGWNYLLANIALGIAGIGIFYTVAGLINFAVNGHFSFFSETDSLKKIEKLENTIHAISSHSGRLL